MALNCDPVSLWIHHLWVRPACADPGRAGQPLASLAKSGSLPRGQEQTEWILPIGELSWKDREEVADLGTSGPFYNLIGQLTFLQRSKARSGENPETNESSSMWKYESRESEHCLLSHVDCAVHTLGSCKVQPCEFPLINQANIRSLSWADFLHLHLFKKVLVVITQSLPCTSPWKGSSVIIRWVLQSQEHEEKSGGNLGKWMLEKLWGTKRSRWKKNGGISDSAAENYVSPPQCLKNSVKNFSYFEVVLWLLNWAPLTRFHPENCIAFGWIWKVS